MGYLPLLQPELQPCFVGIGNIQRKTVWQIATQLLIKTGQDRRTAGPQNANQSQSQGNRRQLTQALPALTPQMTQCQRQASAGPPLR